MEYYVYVYLDQRKPGKYIYGKYTFDYEPIYIGKGKGNRYKQHVSQCLLHPNKSLFYKKLNSILKDYEAIYFILEDKLSNDDACKKETTLISLIGKISEINGSLCNLTDGGEGTPGYIMSNSTKEKISFRNSGENNGMYGSSSWHPMKEYFGIEKTQELKEKISISLKNGRAPWKGKNLPEQMKTKISETLKERFKDKENHPRFGKSLLDESKKKISNSLKKWYDENPTIFIITNEETNTKIELIGRKNVINFIYKYKEKYNLLNKRYPAHTKLLSSGKCYPFILNKK